MGSKVSAQQAFDWGLVNQVVDANELDGAIERYTRYFATAPTKAIGLIKKMLNRSFTASLEDTLEYEAYCQEIAGRSKDYQEGVKAFIEKRQPKFVGE